MKTTFLLGEATTGKSRAANLITRGEKVCTINCRNLIGVTKKDLLSRLQFGFLTRTQKDTTLLLFDDLPAKHIQGMMDFLLQSELFINPQGKAPFTISPMAIVITDAKFENLKISQSQLYRYTFYTCIENKDHEINMLLHHPEQIDQAYSKL